MDFKAHADAWHAGRFCRTCGAEIYVGQPVYFDIDAAGDDGRDTDVVVECKPCHDAEMTR